MSAFGFSKEGYRVVPGSRNQGKPELDMQDENCTAGR